jgi:predicted Rossmann fold nucleotide-binding protein DprA/Smf involved in DNA uptake
MERECLDLLLRGNQPVILCSAKGLNRLKLGKSARTALKDGRLLALSPFDETIRRTTADRAIIRNNLVATMSVAMLIPHATSGGKTWQTARQSLETVHPVFTFDDEANTGLKDMGAKAYPIDIVCQQISRHFDRIKTPHEDQSQIK